MSNLIIINHNKLIKIFRVNFNEVNLIEINLI